MIFNTNENIVRTGHNPIAVIDPTNYGGRLDDKTPVVVAYNLVHYESLHPVNQQDIEETIKLTNAYVAKPSRYEEIYGFTRDDIQYLVSSSASKPIKEGEKAKQTLPEVKSSKKSVHDSLEANKSNRSDASYKINKGDIFLFEKGTIKFEEIKDGKIQCGCCKGSFSRIVGHLTKNRDCASKIDLIEFKSQWLKFTQRKRTAKCYQKKRQKMKRCS